MAKKIHDLAQNALATSSTTSHEKTSKKMAVPITWISALFKKFQGRYGTKWVACIEGIEEEAVKEWAEGLYGLTGLQIKKGLDSLDDDWPPSLPAFKKACGKVKKHWGHNSGAYVETLSLPKPEIDPEKLEQHREKLRESVEGFRNATKGEEADDFVSDPEKRAQIERELKELGL